ncbi:unnamed protein product [Rhizophagus irregularis]|nr:unnamed protein product [Rhizophagus irregularis]
MATHSNILISDQYRYRRLCLVVRHKTMQEHPMDMVGRTFAIRHHIFFHVPILSYLKSITRVFDDGAPRNLHQGELVKHHVVFEN